MTSHAAKPSRRGPYATVGFSPSGPEGPALSFTGRLDSIGVASVWEHSLELAAGAKELGRTRQLIADLSGVTYLDGAGVGLLTQLRLDCEKKSVSVDLRGLSEEFKPLLAMFDADDFCLPPEPRHVRPNVFEEIGKKFAELMNEIQGLIAYVGELYTALYRAALHPGSVRWTDFFHTCETAGVNAFPIVALIGFLMGLIMAFQSAVPLQRFGADIFVADLLGISMVRELGPLVTAILLAGRSGAAFAAEIGTMKVNEEVDALSTMGLDPLRFLAVPRVLAAMVMTPLLTVFFNIFALTGGGMVVMGFGYPLVTYVNHVHASLTTGDLLGGLFKALVFSVLVAGIGCRKGLTTGTGASAVGASTTSAVVSGLVLIAVSDGVMAVLFYSLGI